MKTLKRFFLLLLVIELILVGFYCAFQSLCEPSLSNDEFFTTCRNEAQNTIEILAIIPLYIGTLILNLLLNI